MAIACGLNIGGVWRAMIAEDDRHSGHAFPPDQPDLDLFTVGLLRDDRSEPALGEVGSGYSAVRLFEHFSDAERDRLKMRLQQAKSDFERDESNLLRLVAREKRVRTRK